MANLIVTLWLLTYVSKVVSRDYYTAAVVEYHTPPTPEYSADQVLESNAAVYVEYMANASKLQVDIIVFPEGGLNGLNKKKTIAIPSPSDKVAPCDNKSYHKALVTLSCGSRQSALYSVVNLVEEFFNSTTNKTELYNTNVAFDRNGVVIGRYRKFNPYGENVTKPATPDHHFFETDFGVRFGMFICFDIEFQEPAITLARAYNIKHFVFPHCWISELPFLTALQAQWGWAYALDVSLLAAGCNRPERKGSGSGIYLGRKGALQTVQTNEEISSLLVANVSKNFDCAANEDEPIYILDNDVSLQTQNKNDQEISGIYLMDKPVTKSGLKNTSILSTNTFSSLQMLQDYMLVYESQSFPDLYNCNSSTCASRVGPDLALTKTTKLTLCNNDLCCDFEVNTTSSFVSSAGKETTRGEDFSQYHHRLVVFDGVRWYGGGLATGGVQVCGIVSCVNESLASCGLRSDDTSRRLRVLQDESYGQLFQTSIVFNSISIVGTFHYNNSLVFPDLMVTGEGNNFGSLVPSDYFTFNEFGPFNDSLLVSLKVETPISKLVTAAIYSRQFDRDGQTRTEVGVENGYKHQHRSLYLICISLIVIINCVGVLSNVSN